MSATPTVTANTRTQIGTGSSRRLRNSGRVPGNIYGLNQPNVTVSFAKREVTPIVASGALVLDVTIPGESFRAVIREAQWDTFFTNLLHIDLQRIDPDARVEIAVPVEARGVPGHGVLDQQIHSINISCLAYRVPVVVLVKVAALKMGESITISQLELPEGVVCNMSGELVVMRLLEPNDAMPEQGISSAIEPELITKGKLAKGDSQ